ncbi:ABC transporter substrate-binding protein [Paenibacillus sp. J22TS3]|uniref:ABC transporter substrate-binding protein n=1 Tax=Paenibacillus sp. J22TS3 TaxID=2807192 RepID=UPI001B00564A|nr:extracellular solute-binding protein [Paenibacillus sp. J22TS3]GIP20442.1 sugar ABC transporter substrate-binding protein [Paenibacillus sp. J22TS3]
MNFRKGKRKKAIVVCLTLLLLTSLLAACSENKAAETKENKVLRIAMLYGGSEDWFRQKYVDAFEYTHPNVTVEVVSSMAVNQFTDVGDSSFQTTDVIGNMKKLMKGTNPPDVVVADTTSLKKLADSNMLKELDPLIQQDKFDTSDIVPGVLEGLKQISGKDTLYALSPTFQPAALYYNKGIFQKAGVELPRDGMTYDEVFELARRVTSGEGKDHITGISLSPIGATPIINMRTYAAPLGLKMYDEKAEKMTVNTPGWEKVWNTLSKLHKDKIIDGGSGEIEDGTIVDMSKTGIMTGKIAMELGDISKVRELIGYNKAAKTNKKMTPIEWGVVTPPVHPEKPGVGSSIYIGDAMAINSNAPSPDTAWEFIKSVNSPEWAKVKAKSVSYEMVTRKSFIKPVDGENYNVEAFLKLSPAPPANANEEELSSKKPQLNRAIYIAATAAFQEVVDGKKTVKEGLAEWESKGNEMLKYLEKDPTATFTPDGTPVPSKAGGSGTAK